MQLNSTEILAFQRQVKSNPVFYHDDVLGASPLWSKQKELLTAPLYHKKVAVRAGQGVGKTFTLGSLGLWWMSVPDSILVTTAPSNRQVKTLLWGDMRAKYNNARMSLGPRMDLMHWRISDDWYAIGFSTDKPVNAGGFHGKRLMLIVDEASGMEDQMLDAMEAMTTSKESRVVYSGNPLRADGRFYDAFKDPEFYKIHISCLDHPNVVTGHEKYAGMVTKEWVESRRQQWKEGSPLWLTRVEGEFFEGGSEILVPIQWMEAAKEREVRPNDTDHVEGGADISDGGTDETSLCARRGPVVLASESWHPGRDETMATVGRIVLFIVKWKIKEMKVDSIGVGAGVTTRLMELSREKTSKIYGVKIIGVKVGEPAYDIETYQTRRDEIAYGMADRFQAGDVDMRAVADDEELCSQITSIKKGKPSSRGQLKAESKADMKKRGLASPDRWDGLCLAFCKQKGRPILSTAFTT